jgi:hypothetical protein
VQLFYTRDESRVVQKKCFFGLFEPIYCIVGETELCGLSTGFKPSKDFVRTVDFRLEKA